jgi:Ca2+-binding EF-hand superfamily protein
MNAKKFLVTAMSATLLVGAAAGTTFAAPGRHEGKGHHAEWRRHRIPPQLIYVWMLQHFDTQGLTKITKDEAKAGTDKLFDEIDTNKDGSITPGELRAYHEAQIKAWKADHQKMAGDNAKSGDEAKTDDEAQNGNGGHDGHKDGKRQHRGGPHGMMMRSAMLFRLVDTDESGQISKQEAETAMDKLFDRMDRNHDGVVNIDDMPNFPLL